MALISLRQLLDHAAEHNYGVPAFNVNNLEQTRAIMEAADATNSPVIMQASAGARKYAGAPFLRAMMEAAMNEFPHIPVVVHQDHGVSVGGVPALHPAGFQFGDDGRLPGRRWQNPDGLRLQRGRHPPRGGDGPRLWRLGGGRAGLPGFAGDRARPERRTVSAPRAS